jgi:hypothetical protein
MIHVWLLHHSTHGMLDRSVSKLVICVLLPDLLQIEEWTTHLRLQELQVPRVCHGICRVVKVRTASREPLPFRRRIAVFFVEACRGLGATFFGRSGDMFD